MTVWVDAGPNPHRSQAGLIWLQGRHPKATVERLAHALRSAGVDARDIAAARLEPDGSVTLYTMDHLNPEVPLRVVDVS